jgi:hypothetical protein
MLRALAFLGGRSCVFEPAMSAGRLDSLSDGSINAPAAPEGGDSSRFSVALESGSSVTLWHGLDLEADTSPEHKLQLSPDRPAIIGRSEGHAVHYLDPSYRPTRRIPGTGQNIMHSGGGGSDLFVSRGHFMLRAIGRGVLLVNGVPRPGGGLRPPRNGTWLIVPEQRPMSDGEEYLIESGATVAVGLPNGSVVRISVESGTEDVPTFHSD